MGVEAAGLVLLLGTLFGTMSVIARYMLQQFDPMSFSAVRLVLAALIFLIIFAFGIRGKHWPKDRQMWKRAILFGVIADGVQIILYISSLQYLSAGLVTILATFFPVVSVILAHFLLPNEKLTLQTGLGILLSLGGTLLIVAMGETGLDASEGNSLRGYAFLFCSGLIMCMGTIYARKFMVTYDTFDVVSIRMISAAMTATILALIFEPAGIHEVNNLGIVFLIYSAGVFFFGFLLTFYVLKKFGVTVSAIINYIPPIVANILGAVFLAEKITTGMIIGMILIFSGVAVINFIKRKPKGIEDAVTSAQGISILRCLFFSLRNSLLVVIR